MSACPCLRQGFPKENGLRQSCLTRLARQARGGLFALRVTRRGRLDIGGLDDRMIRCLKKINGKLMKIGGIDGKSTEIDASKWNIDYIQRASMETDLD